MNIPDPYTVTIDDDGLSVRVEWNAHYFTDGELQMLRDHTAAIKTENDKLRRLVRDMWRFTGEACKKYPRLFDPPAQGPQMVQLNAIEAFEQRMREQGVEVDG